MSDHKSEPIALIDMDGTLCDYSGALTHDLEQLRSPHEDDGYTCPEEHDDDPPGLINRRRLIKSIPGWWHKLAPLYDGMLIADILYKIGFDLHILTKGPSSNANAWKEKVEWCGKHMPRTKVTITSDKGLVYGKVLVDDWIPYVKRWLEWRPRGLVILPDRPWNNGFTHPNVRRFKSFYSILVKDIDSPTILDNICDPDITKLMDELTKIRADCA